MTNTLASDFSHDFSPYKIDFLPNKIVIDPMPTDETFGEKLGENFGIIIQTIFNNKYRPITYKQKIIYFNTNFRDTIIEFYLVLAELNYTMSDRLLISLISSYIVEQEEAAREASKEEEEDEEEEEEGEEEGEETEEDEGEEEESPAAAGEGGEG